MWDAEAAIVASSRVPVDEGIILRLPAHTDGKILADIAVVRLIATLAARSGSITIKDYTAFWESSPAESRYLRTLDGVAALVHDDGSHLRLINRHGVHVSHRLHERLRDRFLKTAKLEDDLGPSRTYVAVDPEFSVPIELDTGTRGGREKFDRQIASALKQFGRAGRGLFNVGEDAREYEDSIHEAVYEIFQNTYEHGRFSVDGGPRRGMRYLRFHTHIEYGPGQLAQRSEPFAALSRYFSRRSRQKGSKRFFEVSIGDEGMGIVAHYLRAVGEEFDETRHARLLDRILTESLSSKRVTGAGLGLPNAMTALAKLEAFVTLRSGREWLYRDFSELRESNEPTAFERVPTPEPLACTVGTQFTILCDLALPFER